MIKRGILLILILFLAGCAIEEASPPTVVCNAPYIRHADDCCLDQNSNQLCDEDEEEVIIEVPEEPTIEVPKPVEEPVIKIVEECELNEFLECVGAELNETGLEIELKNNYNNTVSVDVFEIRGYCTTQVNKDVEVGKTIKIYVKCNFEEEVSKVFFEIIYGEYGELVNQEKSGKVVFTEQ